MSFLLTNRVDGAPIGARKGNILLGYDQRLLSVSYYPTPLPSSTENNENRYNSTLLKIDQILKSIGLFGGIMFEGVGFEK